MIPTSTGDSEYTVTAFDGNTGRLIANCYRTGLANARKQAKKYLKEYRAQSPSVEIRNARTRKRIRF